MTAQGSVQIGERTVTVKELTVAEVRAWVTEIESGFIDYDAVGSLIFSDCNLSDLARLSDLEVGEMETLSFSDLSVLRDRCKALNPHFFRVREALKNVSRAMIEEANALVSTEKSLR